MYRTWPVVLALVLAMLRAGSFAASPAVVNLNVAASGNASDTNPGTPTEPLATLNEAMKRALANRADGVSTHVLVHPGTYRQSLVAVSPHPSTGAQIVFEATQPHAAVVTGADRWGGWACSGGVCSHAWPYRWGAAPDPWSGVQVGELARRRELISVNGVNLGQVLSRGALVAGSFFVDEGAGVVYVMPPSGVDLGGADVEVGVRPTLVMLEGLGDVVLKGFTFTHAASVFREAALNVLDDSNVLVDDCVVVWNGQNGLALRGRGLSVQNSTFDHNGSSGLQGFKLADVKITDSEASFNNWRGVRGGYTTWEVGQKFIMAHDLTFTGFRAVGNMARGLWFDTDIENVTVKDSYLCGNLEDGLFVEKAQGPVVVSGTTVCDNKKHGILTSAATELEIEGSTLQNNGQSQLAISGELNAKIMNWVTGAELTLNSMRWTVDGNVLAGEGDQNLVTTTLPQGYWNRLMQGSHFAGNDYLQPQLATPFQIPDGRHLDFEAWAKLTGEITTSRFNPKGLGAAPKSVERAQETVGAGP